MSLRIDPFRAFNFTVALIDSSSSAAIAGIEAAAAAGFSECGGLELSLDVEEYHEGGNNATVLKFPSRIKWSNLRLKRGVTLTNQLWDWHYQFVQGKVTRRDGIVALLDELQVPVRVWSFSRGLPVKWTGPALNAAQNNVAIEELEIAHEGLRVL